MLWARLLAYVTGTVDQELLLRNEYLAVVRENDIRREELNRRADRRLMAPTSLEIVDVSL